jgi:hypothetical protein
MPAQPQPGVNALYGENPPPIDGSMVGAPGPIDVGKIVDHVSYDAGSRSALGAFFGSPEGRDKVQQIADNVRTQYHGGDPNDPESAFNGSGAAAGSVPRMSTPGMPDYSAWKAANPQYSAGRPVVDSGPTSAWGKLGLALSLGAAEFGHAGVGAGMLRDMADRHQAQVNAQNQYDQNLEPRLQNEYQSQRASADTHAMSVEQTNNLRVNNPQMQRRASLLNELATKASTLQNNPAALSRLKAEYAQKAQWGQVQLADGDLDNALKTQSPTGVQYTIEKGEGGRPSGLRDSNGYFYGPNQIPQDAQAQQVWSAGQAEHSQARAEKLQDETTVANNAAARQGAAFGQAVTAANTSEERKRQSQGREASAKVLAELRDAQMKQNVVAQLTKDPTPTNQTSLIFKALDLDLPEGSHRVNDTMINEVKKQGNLSDKAEQALRNWTQGQQFAPDIVKDLLKTAKIITDNKIKKANDSLEDNFNTFGYRDPRAYENGRFDTAPAPAGATQEVADPKTNRVIGHIVNGQYVPLKANK